MFRDALKFLLWYHDLMMENGKLFPSVGNIILLATQKRELYFEWTTKISSEWNKQMLNS